MKHFLIIGLISFGCLSPAQTVDPKINGLCLVAPPYPIEREYYDPIVRTNANWVAIIPYAFCSQDQPEVLFDHPHQWHGETTAGTKEAIQHARDAGLKILLKPHLWVKHQGWAGDLNYTDSTDLQIWKDSYRDYLIHFALLAETLEVDLLSIGTEIRKIAQAHPEYWKSLIRDLRKVYSGPMTYSANWDNFENIAFWSELDYIGIDAYFPTSAVKTPEVTELVALNTGVAQRLEKFSNTYIKKVLFTEYGFRSVDYCTAGHWQDDISSKEINFEAQANAYEALYQTYWNQPWFAGGFAWKWEYRLTVWDQRRQKEFSPRAKKAEKILTNWYFKYQNP